MISYQSAWLIAGAAALVGVAAFYMLVREVIGSLFWRVMVCAVALAALLVPAPVPGYPSNYAPAFIVAIFEGVFQHAGQPAAAVHFLLAGTAATAAVVALAGLGWRHWKRPQSD